MRLQIEIGGERVAFDQAGSGEALLFLHSLGASRVIWQGMLRAFSARYRCLAPDNLGHGESTRHREIDAGRIVDAHLGLLDALGVRQVHIIGVSMGGCWALEMWRRRPAVARSLVICDSFASVADPESAIRERRRSRRPAWPILGASTRPPCSRAPPAMRRGPPWRGRWRSAQRRHTWRRRGRPFARTRKTS
ncbi:MAG: alpha/beta fold hydrolase [bacterium]|nr:alpha/beta fold hydrolase [bacterium]